MRKQSNSTILNLLCYIASVNFLTHSTLVPILTALFLRNDNNFFPPTLSFNERAIILGFILATPSIAIFLCGHFAGKISDAYGRKIALMLTTFCVIIGNTIVALSIITSNVALLFLGRFLGSCMGGTSAHVKSVIADISSNEDKSKNMSHLMLAVGFSGTIGPLIGGEFSTSLHISWFDYSIPPLMLAFLSLCNFPILLLGFNETLKKKCLFTLKGLNPLRELKQITAIHHKKSMLLIIFLFSLASHTFGQTFQIYLVHKFDITVRDMGYIFSFIGFTVLLAQFIIIKPLAKHLHPYKGVKLFLCIYILGLLMVLSAKSFEAIFFVLPLCTIPKGLIQTFKASIVSFCAKNTEQATFQTVARSIQAFADLLGPILGGCLSAILPVLPIPFAIVLCVVVLILFIKFTKKHPSLEHLGGFNSFS